MKVLVTGAAGFIGMHCAERLAARGDEVIGLDNLSPYYSVELKESRLGRLRLLNGVRIERLDLADARALEEHFAATKSELMLHLAAHLDYIAALERALGKTACRESKPMQPGDVQATWADTECLSRATGFAPSTPLEEGLEKFARWFKSFYGYA